MQVPQLDVSSRKAKRASMMGLVSPRDSHQAGMVNEDMLSWLAMEREMERQWKKLQEESFVTMLKRNQRIGQGNKESDRLTVGPYRGSRVKLSRLDSLEEHDDPTFINASYITDDYIAAAMPYNAATERDFWRMLLEHNVGMVVMLNRPCEQEKRPYWPKHVNEPVLYSDLVQVTMLEERYDRSISSYVRKFEISMRVEGMKCKEKTEKRDKTAKREKAKGGREQRKGRLGRHRKASETEHSTPTMGSWKKVHRERSKSEALDGAVQDLPAMVGVLDLDADSENSDSGSEDAKEELVVKHVVRHVQYDDWDDMRIPDDKETFVQLMHFVQKEYVDGGKNAPLVAHCFGGAGRTGTFLTIHITLQEMMRIGGKAINVLDLVGMMRNERAFLVQTQEQYKFCYRIILEFYESRRLFREGVLGGLQEKTKRAAPISRTPQRRSSGAEFLTPVKPVVKQQVQVIVDQNDE